MLKRDRNRVTGAVACVAAAIALLVASAAPSGAASQNVEYALAAGSITIGGTSYTLPASTSINGTWDDVTGDFTGTFTSGITSAQQNLTTPVVGTIDLTQQFVAASPVTGNIDPTTGNGTLNVSMNVVITFIELTLDADPQNPLALGQVCTIANVPMVFTATGTPAPAAPTFTNLGLVASGFTAPAATCTGGANPALTPVLQNELNTTLELPNSQTSASLRFQAGTAPTTTSTSTTSTTIASTTTTAPTTTTTAVAAAAVTAQPVYTG